jgi:hypothetical protein
VAEDGSVLAGVELELPRDGVAAGPQRKFFWSVVWSGCGCLDAYDQAAIQAIRFLQAMFGFVVRDYNYDCMIAYRDSVRSAVLVAVCAAGHLGQLEKGASPPVSATSVGSEPTMGQPDGQALLDWHLLCSCLMASVCYV